MSCPNPRILLVRRYQVPVKTKLTPASNSLLSNLKHHHRPRTTTTKFKAAIPPSPTSEAAFNSRPNSIFFHPRNNAYRPNSRIPPNLTIPKNPLPLTKAMRRITNPVRILPLLSVFLVGLITRARSHHESGPWVCDPGSQVRVDAQFSPGIVTLDGRADDWKDVDGSEFSLLPALDPDEDKEYKGGKMIVKALHDGRSVYFLLQVNGDYAYTKGDSKKCPSIALMFQIDENATYHNMGGCNEGTDTCTSKTCKGHEVDIMHFSIGNSIPGRIYGGNPVDNGKGNGGDRFGHLVDLFSWMPHCRFLDGTGPSGNDSSAQNDWSGAWWHSSLTVHSGFVEEDHPYASNGQKGTYFFEFSRPLQTMDHIQQDVQFSIGDTTNMAVAFWYPVDETPWHGSGHYSINCDWVPLDASFGGTSASLTKVGSTHSWDTASAFSLLFAVISLCLSIFIVYRVMGLSNIAYKPMEVALG